MSPFWSTLDTWLGSIGLAGVVGTSVVVGLLVLWLAIAKVQAWRIARRRRRALRINALIEDVVYEETLKAGRRAKAERDVTPINGRRFKRAA